MISKKMMFMQRSREIFLEMRIEALENELELIRAKLEVKEQELYEQF